MTQQTAHRSSRSKRPSSFALKQIMAVTGVIFVLFVFVHMIGNLKIYQGADALNSYAQWLREVGYPLFPHQGVLWVLRIVLLTSLIAHIYAAITLWLRGRRARGRHRRRTLKGLMPLSAKAMLPGGLVIVVFVVLHLLDLTIGAVLAPEAFQQHGADGTIHAYENLVASFQRPWMAIFYVVTMVIIGFHVAHGWRTLLQDWGAGRRFRQAWTTLGALIAIAIVVGNALIPILVLAGVFA